MSIPDIPVGALLFSRDTGQFYTYVGKEGNVIHVLNSDGGERNYVAPGNLMWVVSEDKREAVLDAYRKLNEAKLHMDELLKDLQPT